MGASRNSAGTLTWRETSGVLVAMRTEMTQDGDPGHSLPQPLISLTGSGYLTRQFLDSEADVDIFQSDPWIYESPKMFRHGSDLYLVARTDPGGPFWSHDNPLLNTLPPWEHHLVDLVNFSFRQHGTAIWRLDQATGQLEKMLELPGCGDTAFPSIVRLQEIHHFKNLLPIFNRLLFPLLFFTFSKSHVV